MFTLPSAAPRKVTQDDAHRAAATLGVDLSGRTAPDQVRTAFRVCLRAVHPDTGGEEGAAADRIKQLGTARDTLLAWLAQAPKVECKECRGTGYVWGRFAVQPCSRCLG